MFELGAEREPQIFGDENLILDKRAAKVVGFVGRVPGNIQAGAEIVAIHAVAQAPNDILPRTPSEMLLEIDVRLHQLHRHRARRFEVG